MKTFVLSADDMQQFTKLIYEQQKTAAANKAAITQMAQTPHSLVVSNSNNNSISINSSNGNILSAANNYAGNHHANGQLTIGLNGQQTHNSTQQQQQQQQPQQPQAQQMSTAAHVMSLQYYLKQPTAVTTATISSIAPTTANVNAGLMVTSNINGNNVNYPTTVIQQSHQQQHQQQQQQHSNQIQQHLQQQQQLHHATHLQQQQQQIPNINHLRIKQPNGQTSKVQHQHQIANGYQHAHQHHPYYGNSVVGVKHYTAVSSAAAHLLKTITTATAAVTSATPQAAHLQSARQQQYQQQQKQQRLPPQQQQQQHASTAAAVAAGVPVHALNQNSNFSAASSSTGGGTNSSHAPTQQSNTTGSSLSPPAALSANPRTQPHTSQQQQQQHYHQPQQHYQNQVNKITSNTAIATTINVTGGIIPPPRYTIVNATSSAALISAGGSSAPAAAASCKKIKTEPLLSEMFKNERLSFANAHLTWSQENWRRLLLHDERKFNLDGPDGYSSYYHDLRNNERLLSQRPRGNSVYIHLLVTAVGPIHIEVATSKIGADCIIETLLRQRSNIITKLGQNDDFMLQDHNWTANALPAVQELLNTEGIKTQKWPTIAHDFDIMENIWGWIIREVYDNGRKFSRKDDLIFRIREAWARLPMDLIRNLYSTMPERISELYQTLGNYTNC